MGLYRLFRLWVFAVFIATVLGVSSCQEDTPPQGAAPPDISSWGSVVPLLNNEGVIDIGTGATELRFLHLGGLSFEPTSAVLEQKRDGAWVPVNVAAPWAVQLPRTIGFFQRLSYVPWVLNAAILQQHLPLRLKVTKGDHPSPFFNQVIVVDPQVTVPAVAAALDFQEVGEFGEALPGSLRHQNFSEAEIIRQKTSLIDPILGGMPSSTALYSREMTWDELQSKAFTLDYQKVLLAGLHDPAPGFAYQNGQWFVTIPCKELGFREKHQNENYKEDRWFAPALKIGNEVLVPAPLSARTEYVRNVNGRLWPQWRLEWSVPGYNITQILSSQVVNGVPQIVSRHAVRALNATRRKQSTSQQPSLILGMGRRPSVHFWSQEHPQKNLLNYLALVPKLKARGRHAVVDKNNGLILVSSKEIKILQNGPMESLVEIALPQLAAQSEDHVYVSTPQKFLDVGQNEPRYEEQTYSAAQTQFEALWNQELSNGASVRLPSLEWSSRIDAWLTQVMSVSRIDQQLNYGAYYYDMYFGIEEGWPLVALAQWGKGREAKAQAEIMMSAANLDKGNYHHQYRNGLSSWYTAEVARLTADTQWLERMSPALIANAQWTINARRQGEAERSSLTRGLLPRHIYGGDIPTPAYSVYSNATCWRGMVETSDILKLLTPTAERTALINQLQLEANDYKTRLAQVTNEVLVRSTTPAFLPLALELGPQPPGGAIHETPYENLTAHPLGNYWNLFAPLLLHTDLLRNNSRELPSSWIVDYLETHGGLWAGLPRFYNGLDAVYAIGYIHELLERARSDGRLRPKALAALQSYMMHAASSNGYSVPEVSGMFDGRLNRRKFEEAVRGAPWVFGVYDGGAYLRGDISITEPLGAGAGEGLWLMRKALVDETKNQNALADGGLAFLTAVPASWLAEGKTIELNNMPTAYGLVHLKVQSFLESRGVVEVDFHRRTTTSIPLRRVTLRLVAPEGRLPQGGLPEDPVNIELPSSGVEHFVVGF